MNTQIEVTWSDPTDVSSRMALWCEQCRLHPGWKPDQIRKCPHCYSMTLTETELCANKRCGLHVGIGNYLPDSARPPVDMVYKSPIESAPKPIDPSPKMTERTVDDAADLFDAFDSEGTNDPRGILTIAQPFESVTAAPAAKKKRKQKSAPVPTPATQSTPEDEDDLFGF